MADPTSPTELTEEQVTQVYELARIHCSQDEIATTLGMCSRTFRRTLRRYDYVQMAYERGLAEGRKCLRRRLWEIASSTRQDAGKVAIWLSKQLLGYRDRIEVGKLEQQVAELEHKSDEELLAEVRRLASLIGDEHSEGNGHAGELH